MIFHVVIGCHWNKTVYNLLEVLNYGWWVPMKSTKLNPFLLWRFLSNYNVFEGVTRLCDFSILIWFISLLIKLSNVIALCDYLPGKLFGKLLGILTKIQM